MSELIAAFGINWKLLVIQAINFGVLLIVLYKFLYIPVLKLLDERKRAIEQGLEDAHAAELALKNAEEEKASIVSRAVLEANTIVNDSKKHAQTEGHQIVKEAQEKSNQLIVEAEKRAEEEKVRIMREAEKEIAQMVILGIEQSLKTNPR